MTIGKQNLHHIMIVSTALTVTASLVLLGFIAWPSIREIINLNERIYQERVELEKLYRKGQILKQTLQDYQDIKPEISKFTSIYVIPGNELDFISTLEKVAQEQKVDQQITLSPADSEAKKTNTLPLQLQISGTLASFLKYLAGVEQLDYYLNIDTLRLTNYQKRSSAFDDNYSLTTFLLGSAYYKP